MTASLNQQTSLKLIGLPEKCQELPCADAATAVLQPTKFEFLINIKTQQSMVLPKAMPPTNIRDASNIKSAQFRQTKLLRRRKSWRTFSANQST
jgi:hypothetical protein